MNKQNIIDLKQAHLQTKYKEQKFGLGNLHLIYATCTWFMRHMVNI